MTIENSLYEERAQALEGMSIAALWDVSCPNDQIWNDSFSFEEKKIYFFSFLEKLMRDNKIMHGKHGKFLEGSIEDQIARYQLAFPKTEDDWKARGEDIWFYEEYCPGGIVWVYESGYLDWT